MCVCVCVCLCVCVCVECLPQEKRMGNLTIYCRLPTFPHRSQQPATNADKRNTSLGDAARNYVTRRYRDFVYVECERLGRVVGLAFLGRIFLSFSIIRLASLRGRFKPQKINFLYPPDRTLGGPQDLCVQTRNGCPCRKGLELDLPVIKLRHHRHSSSYCSFSPSFGATAPSGAMASSFTRFLDHTQRHTPVGRTSLDE